MERLRVYVEGADEAVLDDLIRRWSSGEGTFRSAGEALHTNGKKVEDGFSSASETGPAARREMQQAGEATTDKSDVLKEAVAAMQHFRGTLATARSQYAKLAASLPASHGPAPDRADYPTSGTGVDGAANAQAFKAKQAEHAAAEAAIAHAETEAAAQVGYVDDAVREDQPKIRALYDDGTNSEPLPSGTPTSQPGSYSQIQASKARIATTNTGTLYPDGMGFEIHEQERANIKAYEAENKPEWNGTQWIDAYGNTAPATSYAMVETAEGLAPVAGGPGMGALAIGGLALGAGIAKAVASRLGAARAAGAPAKAGAAGKTAASGARSAAPASRAGAAGARAGAPGQAGRAGARGGNAGMAGSGSRQGLKNAARGGPGAAGGRGGRGKDEENAGEAIDYQADYSKDYSDDDYEKLVELQRQEKEQRKRYRGESDE
jgi:hypothetical protein